MALREDYESYSSDSEEESEWVADDPLDSDYEAPDRMHVMTCDGVNTHIKFYPHRIMPGPHPVFHEMLLPMQLARSQDSRLSIRFSTVGLHAVFDACYRIQMQICRMLPRSSWVTTWLRRANPSATFVL